MASPASYFNFSTGTITGLTDEGNAVSVIEIPSEIDGVAVVRIGDNAFDSFMQDCTNLTSVIIPDSVTSIGNSAFYGCTNLTNVDISDNLITIENSAFENCTSLSSVIIPDSVASIGNGAFKNTGIVNIVIPKGVNNINYGVFYCCTKLTTITIPDSVTSIGDRAFQDCTSLITVNYTGNEEQWNAIDISSTNNNPLINATKVYNYVPPAPSFSGEDNQDLGTISPTGTVTYTYTVTAPNGGTVHVDEAVDGVIFNSFDTTSGNTHTLTLNVKNLPTAGV